MNNVAIHKAQTRKKQDASKAEKGSQIILCQNNIFYGHRITHVVEVVSDEAEEKNDTLARDVRVTWVARIPWENYAPLTKNLIGDKFSFNSGYLVSIHSPSIKLDLNILDS